LISWLKTQDNPYEIGASNFVSDKYLQQIHALSSLLQDLKKNDYTVPEAVDYIVSYYKSFCEKKFDDYPKRLKDLEAFVGISENYSSFNKMLEELALDPIESTALETEASQKDENPLILSTIHSAKGLEWNNVFIIQCLDGIIPSGFSVNSDDDLDEELRLLYVACTRAKNNLYISYPVIQNTTYGEYFSNPSRFINDIEEKLLEPWVLVEESETEQNKLENPDTSETLPESNE